MYESIASSASTPRGSGAMSSNDGFIQCAAYRPRLGGHLYGTSIFTLGMLASAASEEHEDFMLSRFAITILFRVSHYKERNQRKAVPRRSDELHIER